MINFWTLPARFGASILLGLNCFAPYYCFASAMHKDTGPSKRGTSATIPLVHNRKSVMIPYVEYSSKKPNQVPTISTFNRVTYLDSMASLVTDGDPKILKAWKIEIAEGTTKAREARLRIQIGETLVGKHEPDEAEKYLHVAASLLPTSSKDRGLARYDESLCMFFEGRFRDCENAFRNLLKSPLTGYDRKLSSLYLKHAAACQGYHDQHANLGIPQPTRLDPLCGVSALAVCLKGRGLSFDKSNLVQTVHHDGEGSDIVDLLHACSSIGLVGRVVQADDTGLKKLQKPLVAHIEHDHFIAVTRADNLGVSYVCSDCGPWPGGEVRLTWKQWHALDADAYLAVAKVGTNHAVALNMLSEQPSKAGASDLFASTSSQLGGSVIAAREILAALGTHAVAFPWLFPSGAPPKCGMRGTSPACLPFVKCPKVSKCSKFGPDRHDPVNMATGEEEYELSPDLTIYNPSGPSVSWSRSYYSLSNPVPTGFGSGWSHSYNYRIEKHRTSSGTLISTNLVFPNSSRLSLPIASLTSPTAVAPTTPITTVQAGTPFAVDWIYDVHSPLGSKDAFTVTDKANAVWTYSYGTSATSGAGDAYDYYYPTKIQDKFGNYINLQWNGGLYNTVPDPNTGAPATLNFTGITDSSGTSILSLSFDTLGEITSATGPVTSTLPGRGVTYSYLPFSAQNVPANLSTYNELVYVSEPTLVNLVAGSLQFVNNYEAYSYSYSNVSNLESTEKIPYLTTIHSLDPNYIGQDSTATINYSNVDGSVTSLVDGNSNTTTIAPMGPFSLATFSDGGGNITQQTKYFTDNRMSATSTVAYVDPVNTINSTQFAFGSADPYSPSSATDANGRVTTYDWDIYGNLKTVITPKGTTTTYTWSYPAGFRLGRLSSVTTGTKVPTSFTYYANGALNTISTPIPWTGTTNTSTQSTTINYTAKGDISSVLSPGNTLGNHLVTYNYGSNEKLGEPTSVTDSAGKTWTYAYDDQGNVISASDPLGHITTTAYNDANQPTTVSLPITNGTSGRAKVVTTHGFPNGPVTKVERFDDTGLSTRITLIQYDAGGRLLWKNGENEFAYFQYDSSDRVNTVQDWKPVNTTYTYDWAGRLTKIVTPGSPADTTQFKYDSVGNVTQRTDANGAVINYTYADGDGLLSYISYPGVTGKNVTLSYDAYDRLTGAFDGVGNPAYGYDDLDNVRKVTENYTSLPSQVLNYTFYPDGSRSSMVNPGGTWNYAYDGAGRLTSMASPIGNSGEDYLDNGLPHGKVAPNGLFTAFTFNAVNQLTSLSNQNSGGLVLGSYTNLAYDGVFNLTGLSAYIQNSNTGFSGTKNYTYNTQNRVTSDTGSLSFASHSNLWSPDAVGNAQNVRGAAISYNAKDQRTNGGLFAYDANGNPTTWYANTLGFDRENRLTSLGSGFTAGYRWDGLRAWKQVNGARTYFLYDRGQPVVELNATGAVTAVNVFGSDGLVGRKTGAVNTFYAFDPQGNVSQVVDSAQNVVTALDYDAYGAFYYSGAAPSTPFLMNGKHGYYYDYENTLALGGHRYYSPGETRWLTRDPIGQSGGVNLYAYCQGRPVGNVDPTGLLIGAPAWALPSAGDIVGGGAAGEGAVAGGGAATGGSVALGGVSVVAGAALGAAAVGAGVGTGIDELSGGAYGKWWCQVLGVDCTGEDYLPADKLDECNHTSSNGGGPRITRDKREDTYRIYPRENTLGHTEDECYGFYLSLLKRIKRNNRTTRAEKELLRQDAFDWYTNCLKGRG